MDLVLKAIKFAQEKHKGQFREDGSEYIEHPIVASGMAVDMVLELTACVAVLHDVLEDIDTTEEELVEQFGPRIAYIVSLLTRQEGFSYEEYIQSILTSDDEVARIVKIADLKHNLSTIDNIKDPEKRERLKTRYEQALKVLS